MILVSTVCRPAGHKNQIASLKRKPSGKPSPLTIIGYGTEKESKIENLTVHFRFQYEVSYVAAERYC
jgi:hypothetical protein